MMKYSFKNQPCKTGVEVKKESIPGYKGDMIDIEIYSPLNIGSNAPCLIFLHGGAFTFPAAFFHKMLICDYALSVPCKVIFVDYRLAPRFPYPYGLEDCYSAYRWIVDNSSRYDIDKNKIAVCGDSAGGGLAASLAWMVRDRLRTGLLFQLLVYPVIDSRQITESIKQFVDTPVWDAGLTKKMWKIYLSKISNTEYPQYSSAHLIKSFKNLPACYIEVSEFDCLRDEAIDYYSLLKQDGIEAELHETSGTIHGFELNYKSDHTQQIVKDRIEYMKRQFYPFDS